MNPATDQTKRQKKERGGAMMIPKQLVDFKHFSPVAGSEEPEPQLQEKQ